MAICGSKSTIVACLMIGLLVCMNLIEGTDARDLGYGAIQRGQSPGCSPKHPEECKKKPVCSYNRGCENKEHCRGIGEGKDKIK